MSCYSLDLRKRVIKFIEEGRFISEASRIFKVSRPTIYDWLNRNKRDELKPKDNLTRKPKKLNSEELKIYIKQHPEQTLEKISKHFNTSITAIFKRIKKLGFTYKKKNFSTKKGMKKKEKNTSKKS